ncbi:hypothetical protein I7I48_03729 [Histoplasma ohiense]|nr:hypothetical protein I7I48_03729 [Histoplasma ohiense (nom. inval.)]
MKTGFAVRLSTVQRPDPPSMDDAFYMYLRRDSVTFSSTHPHTIQVLYLSSLGVDSKLFPIISPTVTI